jgi:phage terminase Nu1 subunit (DNA packaging protein)
MLIDLGMQVSQRDFADIIGVSEPAVSGLSKRGVIRDGQSVGEWIIGYCAHLREVAAGRAAAGDLDLASERARLARAQAEKVEMQNAQTRRDLAPVYLIEEVLAKAGARVAGILDAIPGAVRRRVSALSSEEIDMISREIARARNIAAAISLDDLREAEGGSAPDDDSPIEAEEAAIA